MIRTIRRLNQITSSVLSSSRTRASSRSALQSSSRNYSGDTQTVPQTTSTRTWPSSMTLPLENPTSHTSAVHSSYIPISALTNQDTTSLTTSPMHASHSMTPSTQLQHTSEGWAVAPTNLVTADFDFEQSLTSDLIPGGHIYGWMAGTQPSEMQHDGTAYMEMGWLESLFGTDLGSNVMLPPED